MTPGSPTISTAAGGLASAASRVGTAQGGAMNIKQITRDSVTRA